jgi:hypothetical protein
LPLGDDLVPVLVDEELLMLWENLQMREEIGLEEYVNVGQELITGNIVFLYSLFLTFFNRWRSLFLDEIIQGCSNADKDDANENSGSEVIEIDDEDAEVEEPAVISLKA